MGDDTLAGKEAPQQIVTSSSEIGQSGLLSFSDLIRLSSRERRPSGTLEVWGPDHLQQEREKTVKMAIIGSSGRRQSKLLSFTDLIRLSSSERRQLGSPSAVANVAVHIEIWTQLLLMSFVYPSNCHPVDLFLLLHRM